MKRSRFVAFAVISGWLVSLSALAEARKEPIQPIARPTIKNKAEVDLGQKLFFEKRLSKSGFISCNSCHDLATGGVDNLPSSIGHKWNIGPINAPTVLNSKYNFVQFWDGRAKDLYEQAGGPVANPGEMAFTHELAVSVIDSIPGYKPLFQSAYGSTEVTIVKIQKAISAFEETLVTPNSKFDQWLAGNNKALNADELAGYNLFKGKGCVSCHNGPAVGGNSYQKMGLVKAYSSQSKAQGRYDVTKNEADRFKFKVPTLRNIELTYPYFHDGSVWTLEEAVKLMGQHQIGVDLLDTEVAQIVSFLKTLTGDQPKLAIPVLPPSGKNTQRPDLG